MSRCPRSLAALAVTALFILDSRLSRLEATLLLVGFGVWVTAVTRQARRERSATGSVLGERSRWAAVSASVAGLVCLVAAGQLIVLAAKAIGAGLGMDPFVVGATLVAVGTSTPELATTLLARWRGHAEVGLGTVIGSNVFNGLIVAVAALITPIDVPVGEVATGLLFGVLVALPSVCLAEGGSAAPGARSCWSPTCSTSPRCSRYLWSPPETVGFTEQPARVPAGLADATSGTAGAAGLLPASPSSCRPAATTWTVSSRVDTAPLLPQAWSLRHNSRPHR